MDPLGIVVYSDFLCPWCYNVTVRMRRLEAEFAGRIELEWRTYLLRPVKKTGRDAERFRRYTEGWQRPAAEEDAGTFRPWSAACRATTAETVVLPTPPLPTQTTILRVAISASSSDSVGFPSADVTPCLQT